MKIFYSKTLTPENLSDEGKKEFVDDFDPSIPLPKSLKPDTLTSPVTDNATGDNINKFPGSEDRKNDEGYGKAFKPDQDPYENFEDDGDPLTQTTMGPKEGADQKERDLAKELVNKAKEAAKLNNIDPLKLFIDSKKQELKSLPIAFIKFDDFLKDRIDEISHMEGLNQDILNSIVDQFNKVLTEPTTNEEFVKPSKERKRIEEEPTKFIEEEKEALHQAMSGYESKLASLEPKVQKIITEKSSEIEKLMSDYGTMKSTLEEKIGTLEQVQSAPEILEKERALKAEVATLEKELKAKKLELMGFRNTESAKAFPDVVTLMKEAETKYSNLSTSIQTYFNIAHKYGVDVLKAGDTFFMNYIITEQRKHIDGLRNHLDTLKTSLSEYTALKSKELSGELELEGEERLKELQKQVDGQIKILEKSDMFSKKYENNILLIGDWVKKLKTHIDDSERIMDVISEYNTKVQKEAVPVADRLIALTKRTLDQVAVIEAAFGAKEQKKLEKATSHEVWFSREADLKDILESIQESFSGLVEWFDDVTDALSSYSERYLERAFEKYNERSEAFNKESNDLLKQLDFSEE